MADRAAVPRWFLFLVVAAVAVGIALAFWFYGVVA
jgi:hypothetical protein